MKTQEVLPWMVDAAHEIDKKLGLSRHDQAVTWVAEIIASIAPRPARPATQAAAEIRRLLTAALHRQELPEGVTCHLSPALRAAVTPGDLHLLTGRKSTIDAVLSTIIDAPPDPDPESNDGVGGRCA